jgi:hypothetical protein
LHPEHVQGALMIFRSPVGDERHVADLGHVPAQVLG